MLGLDGELAGFEDLLNRFPHTQSTRDAAKLAESILRRWLERSQCEPQSPGQDPDVKSEAQSGLTEAPAGQESGGGASDPDDGRQGHLEGGSGNAGPQARRPSAPPGQASPSGDQKMPPSDQGDSGWEHNEGRDSAPEGPPANDAILESATAQETAPGGARETDGQSRRTAESAAVAGSEAGGMPGRSLVGEAMAGAIADQIDQINTTQLYRPFTRQFDRIELVASAKEAEVDALLEAGRDTVRRLRRGLTNALRSAEKRWWRDDQIRGDLSPRTLHRLCMDRPQLDVFRVRSMVQGQSTAVSILLDASGSMSRRKMDVARSALRVLVEALGDLRIPTEALTFTTGNAMDINQVMQQTGLDAHKLRERYGRLSNLEIGLVQQFGEPVKAVLTRLPSIHGSGLTPLGEAMQITATRLVNRPETRRILLVLTDGKAGCEGGSDSAAVHAQEMAKRITKAGIEVIGVGILDENIRQVVGDSIVIHKLEELPAQLCKLLGRTLKKGMRHVG